MCYIREKHQIRSKKTPVISVKQIDLERRAEGGGRNCEGRGNTRVEREKIEEQRIKGMPPCFVASEWRREEGGKGVPDPGLLCAWVPGLLYRKLCCRLVHTLTRAVFSSGGFNEGSSFWRLDIMQSLSVSNRCIAVLSGDQISCSPHVSVTNV